MIKISSIDDFTTKMFLGDADLTSNSGIAVANAIEASAPKKLELRYGIFDNWNSTRLEYVGKKTIAIITYQCNEEINGIFPIFQVAIAVWKTPKGNIKSEIIKDNSLYSTRFWN